MAATAFAYRTKDNSSSDSDSENSDTEIKDWKRATRRSNDENLEKIAIDPIPSVPDQEPKSALNKRKRNTVWCDVLQGQLMSETLGHCGLKKKPKGYGSRGEESYDYTLSYKHSKEDEDSDDSMSEDETSETTNFVKSFHKPKNFGSKKFVKLDGAGKTAARKIVKTLAETKQYLIFRAVKYLGIEKAMQLLKQTEEIEENGGMMINNNQRRRTPGGIYFQLIKSDKDIEKETLDKIFEGELTSFDMKRLSEERKKQKKLAAEKKKLLKQLEKEVANQQNQVEMKNEENNLVQMEQEDITEKPIDQNAFPNPTMKVSKDSDLEDGEIDD